MLIAISLCVLTTLLATPPRHFLDLDIVNIVMLFLLTVLVVAATLGRDCAVIASALCVVLFDIFFVPPRFSLAVSNIQYLITFAVMLATALVTTQLTAGLKQRAEVSQLREQTTQALYTLARELAGTLNLVLVHEAVQRFIAQQIAAKSWVQISDDHGTSLTMARLNAGSVSLRREWQPLDDVIGASIKLLGAALQSHPVEVRLPMDLPLLEFDAVLMERVFCNLLENSAKYAPANTPIEITAESMQDQVRVCISDRGFPLDRQEELFAMFGRDLLILDLGLPDGNGIVLIRDLRGWTDLPILILSARSQEHDKIAALDAGADDYLTKPFSVGELHVRALLRRAQKPNQRRAASQRANASRQAMGSPVNGLISRLTRRHSASIRRQ